MSRVRTPRHLQAFDLAAHKRTQKEERDILIFLFVLLMVMLVLSGLGPAPA